ncbi:FecR domain-containing protein [Halomonas venusta]|uniref:FecR domain-containing protein n=1 Tax=Vreelandella venusta TaxID=44935 RepID=UPI00295F3C7C|nr:FecR domain-containing protein [Halomonas venusta]MDW0361769.1 FecR domain-containing protein [Halomonas venusta]
MRIEGGGVMNIKSSGSRPKTKSLLRYFSSLVFGSVFLLTGSLSYASDTHQVMPGDTLWDISEYYYGTPDEWPALQQVNAITDPFKLQPDTLVELSAFDPFPLSVLYHSGDAWLVEENSESLLKSGDLIEVGSVIQTGPGSSLTVQMRDGARAVVPSNSRIVLKREGERGITFQLEQGEVESYVPKNRMRRRAYNIETTSGVLGVRGTHFRASYADETLLTSVYEGNVAAQHWVNTAEASIDQGEGARVDGVGGIQVVALLPPPENVTISSLPNEAIQVDISPSTQGQAFRAQIASDPNFLTIMRDQRSQSSQIQFAPLSPGFYHVRIAAIDELGIEGESAIFVIHHHGDQVSVNQEEGAWVFEWLHKAQTNYRLQLAADHQFTQVLLNYEPQNNGPLRISRLPGNEIFWRVVSLDERTDMAVVLDTGTLNDSGK